MTMDYRIVFDESGGIVVTTGGTAERRGFVRFIDEIVDDPRFHPGTTVLVDHSALDMHPLRTDDMQAVAEAVGRLNDRIGRTVVAIVTPASVGYGLSRQFSAFADDSDLRVRVFTTRAEAAGWLQAAAARQLPGVHPPERSQSSPETLADAEAAERERRSLVRRLLRH